MTHMEKYAMMAKLLKQTGDKIKAGDEWTRAQAQALARSSFGQNVGRMGKGAWGATKDFGSHVAKHPVQSVITGAGGVAGMDLISRLLFNKSIFGGKDLLHPEVGLLEDTGLNPHNYREQAQSEPWYGRYYGN